jgi:hypothetical protein
LIRRNSRENKDPRQFVDEGMKRATKVNLEKVLGKKRVTYVRRVEACFGSHSREDLGNARIHAMVGKPAACVIR